MNCRISKIKIISNNKFTSSLSLCRMKKYLKLLLVKITNSLETFEVIYYLSNIYIFIFKLLMLYF